MAEFILVALAGGIAGLKLANWYERVTQEEHERAKRELGWPVKS